MDPEETPASPSNGAQEKTESTERAIKKSRRTKEEWEPGLMESLGFRSSDVGDAVKTVASHLVGGGAFVGVVWLSTKIVVNGIKEVRVFDGAHPEEEEEDDNIISV